MENKKSDIYTKPLSSLNIFCLVFITFVSNFNEAMMSSSIV